MPSFHLLDDPKGGDPGSDDWSRCALRQWGWYRVVLAPDCPWVPGDANFWILSVAGWKFGTPDWTSTSNSNLLLTLLAPPHIPAFQMFVTECCWVSKQQGSVILGCQWCYSTTPTEHDSRGSSGPVQVPIVKSIRARKYRVHSESIISSRQLTDVGQDQDIIIKMLSSKKLVTELFGP
jgi:hypothetical protein